VENCLKCEYHYILDKMVHGFYEIKCRHGRMRDYQVLACFDEEQIAKIKDDMIRVNPPKQCPFSLAFADAMEAEMARHDAVAEVFK